MPLTVLVWLTLPRICRVLTEQLHGPDDGDDPATYLVRQSGPTVDQSLELGIDVHGFCINCCAWRCASSRIFVFLGEFEGGGLNHNPRVGGSSPASAIRIRLFLQMTCGDFWSVASAAIPARVSQTVTKRGPKCLGRFLGVVPHVVFQRGGNVLMPHQGSLQRMVRPRRRHHQNLHQGRAAVGRDVAFWRAAVLVKMESTSTLISSFRAWECPTPISRFCHD